MAERVQANSIKAARSPEEREERRVAARLDRETARARTGLALDMVVGAIWPMAALAACFAAVGALGLWPRLPDLARLGLLAAFGLGLVAAVIYAARKFRWPSRAEARALLDRDAPDRPVASFDETLAVGVDEAEAEALWRAHRRRVAERAASARAPRPQLRVGGAEDPWALRAFSFLALIAAILLRPSESQLADAFAPVDLAGGGTGPASTVELWATPPAYTGEAPLYFADAEDRRGARSTPVGTVVSVRAFPRPGATPELTIEPAPRPEDLSISLEDGALSAEITLREPAQIRLEVAGTVGPTPAIDLRFDATPDLPPRVAFVSEPARSDDGELGFHYAADDDYGIEDAFIVLELDETAYDDGLRVRPPGPFEPERIEISLPRASLTEIESLDEDDALDAAAFVTESFIGHAWVGLPVAATLVVVDGSGQEARSEVRRFFLPGRLYSEPMAKAFMEQRAALAWNLENGPRTVRILEALTQRPEDYFRGFAAYFVARAATSQLGYALIDDRVAEARPEIMERLRRASDLLEDAGLENAWEALTRAMRRLQEALENGASDEELQELMDDLRGAVEDYVRALQELAEQDPELAEQMLQQQQSETLGDNTLEELLNQLEDTARSGARDQAQDMLDSLQQLLESLRPGAPQQAQGGGEGAQSDERSEEQRNRDEAEDELDDLLSGQQDLAEDSFDEFLQRRRERQDDANQGDADQGGQDQAEAGQEQPGEQQGQQPGQQRGPEGQPGEDGTQGQSGGGEPGGREQGGQQPQQGGEPGQQPGDGSTPTDRADGSRSGDPGADGTRRGGPGDLADRQRALRENLDSLRRQLRDALEGADDPDGDVGRSAEDAERAFDEAEEAMRRAEELLNDGRTGPAAEEQADAADALREGSRAIRDAFDRMTELERPEDGEPGAAEEDVARDPLGRERGSEDGRRSDRSGSGGGVGAEGDLFDGSGAAGVRRAQEILEELRRRAAERERPASELDYIDRLLDLFN